MAIDIAKDYNYEQNPNNDLIRARFHCCTSMKNIYSGEEYLHLSQLLTNPSDHNIRIPEEAIKRFRTTTSVQVFPNRISWANDPRKHKFLDIFQEKRRLYDIEERNEIDKKLEVLRAHTTNVYSSIRIPKKDMENYFDELETDRIRIVDRIETPIYYENNDTAIKTFEFEAEIVITRQ